MIKSVVLHVHEDDGFEGRFQVALDICRSFGAHLTCLYVTPYNAYIGFDPLGGISVQAAILESLETTEAALRKRIEGHLGKEDVLWDWVSESGDVASCIAAASALADLIILSQHDDSKRRPDKPLAIVDDVVISATCAVLVVPAGVTSWESGDDAVVGWNASPEAAHAVRAAVPFLKNAAHVHLVSVGKNGDAYPQTSANAYFSRHGIKSDIHQLAGSRRDAAKGLCDFAVEHHANCVVMGAYGRSRLRETIMGGVTNDMLTSSKIPLLLAH
jgi:nucleotide-binding universal stress UspA family protein